MDARLRDEDHSRCDQRGRCNRAVDRDAGSHLFGRCEAEVTHVVADLGIVLHCHVHDVVADRRTGDGVDVPKLAGESDECRCRDESGVRKANFGDSEVDENRKLG